MKNNNQLNNTQKDIVLEVVVGIGIVIACVICIICFYVHQNHTANQQVQENKIANTASEQYDRKLSQTREAVLDHASTNPFSSKVRALGVNNKNMNTVDNLDNQFANIYFNWDNGKQYDSRRDKLTNVVVPNILNSSYFASDLDSDGKHSIDIQQLSESFINCASYVTNKHGNNINAILKVHYRAQNDSINSIIKNATTWFKVTVNTKQNKITQLHKVLNTTD